ncbi:hypothetical protein [Sphingomonas montanisoli]|uniref:Lipoprotein n=1 Tax=Sphingomonas montanisoli TaxID=2606412 RepID=A0A5D9C0L8_9SPHN|nr:hypothetical protein [Sphingomonas montanisoli]TZG25199.1 hypothetical protein FYJ91_18290 [Sphingomonas montanisoli]
MRRFLPFLLTTGLLASCGPKPLELPADPVDKAATCAVVSAARARAAQADIKAELPFAEQLRITHYAMLAGSEGDTFDTERASAVAKKMGELQEKITAGEWQKLEAPCDQAYPVTVKTSGIELPAAKADAQLGCYALADFLRRSVATIDEKGQNELAGYDKMKRALDAPVGAGMKAKGANSFPKTQALKNEALSDMAKLGAPAETMKMCTAKFG